MFKSCLKAFLLSGACLLASTAMAADTQPGASTSALRVTYLVFSGRPNPSVTLADPALVGSIRAQLASVRSRAAQANEAAASKLGYNGVLIESTEADGTQVSYTVKGSVLSVESNDAKASAGAAAFTSAAAADLEARLLGIGQEQGVLDEATLGFLLDSTR